MIINSVACVQQNSKKVSEIRHMVDKGLMFFECSENTDSQILVKKRYFVSFGLNKIGTNKLNPYTLYIHITQHLLTAQPIACEQLFNREENVQFVAKRSLEHPSDKGCRWQTILYLHCRQIDMVYLFLVCLSLISRDTVP